MKIVFEGDPEVAVAEVYDIIKTTAREGVFKAKHIEAIAELTTELANRLKVEEACG